jgi:hypothetical protein
VFGSDFIDESFEVFVEKGRLVDADHFAMYSEDRWVACGEVEIGSLLFAHELEERVDSGHASRSKLEWCQGGTLSDISA